MLGNWEEVVGAWEVWEEFSEEEGFEMDFKGCVERLKREGGAF